MTDAGYLPDVNVWVALASDRHEHHAVARAWFDSTAEPIYFCRVTQMAFLRLLTNARVMGDEALATPEAIEAYWRFFEDDRIGLLPEPIGIEDEWFALMDRRVRGSSWTDGYLGAVAIRAGLRLVSFDTGFRKWRAVPLHCLTA